MPNAYDLQRLTITHSPVEKVDTAFGNLPDLFSPEQILQQVEQFITDLLFPAIESLTGIDLSLFLPTIEAVFDALTTLFGDLNPLSGTFNPLDAITTFIELMVTVGANLPMALIQELIGFDSDIPILSQLVSAITGSGGGLGFLTTFFDDFLGVFGLLGSGLGSGNPVLDVLENIPFFGPLFDNAIELVNGDVIDDLMGAFNSLFGLNLPGFATSLEGLFGSGDLLGSFLDQVPLIRQLVEALTGNSGAWDLTHLFDVFQNIPFENILGFGGPGNLGETFQATWDYVISGLVGSFGSGSGLSDLFDVTNLVSGWASLGRFSFDILGIRNNRGLFRSPRPTGTATMDIQAVSAGASPPTFAVTQSTATMGFHLVEAASDVDIISWIGSGNTNVTQFYVTIWRMNPTNGNLEALVHRSSNIVGNVGASLGYNTYVIPTPIAMQAGEIYAIELSLVGAGTHNVVGQASWVPAHPTAYPKRFGAVRNSGTGSPPSTIAHASLVYANNIPWIEVAIGGTDLLNLPHAPETYTYVDAQVGSTVPIPSWCSHIDAVILGGGGGGSRGVFPLAGEGGDAGHYQDATWDRGVHFSGGTLTITVPSGGSAGGLSGGNGGTATVAVTSTAYSITASGGGGGNTLAGGATGQSPGNHTFNGTVYAGGVAQSSNGANGNAGGGGGAGGNGVFSGPGGAGAPGRIWIRAYQ